MPAAAAPCAGSCSSRSGRNSPTARRSAAPRSTPARSELRQRFASQYGAVAFVDAGQVSDSGVPFTGTPQVGVGVGARYYTVVRAAAGGFCRAGDQPAAQRPFRGLYRHRTGILMRRALHVLGWIVAVAVGVPVLLLLAVVAALNTGPGRRAAVALVNRVAGTEMTLAGLHGVFPGRLRIDRIALHDTRLPTPSSRMRRWTGRRKNCSAATRRSGRCRRGTCRCCGARCRGRKMPRRRRENRSRCRCGWTSTRCASTGSSSPRRSRVSRRRWPLTARHAWPAWKPGARR